MPGPAGGFRKNYSKEANEQGIENLKWRLRNIVIPCGWLLPACQGVTVCISREEAEPIHRKFARRVYPKDYTVANPQKRPHIAVHIVRALSEGTEMPSFEATPMALYYVRQWIQTHVGERKVVTITLREASYRPLRNSSLRDWSLFAKSLDPSRHCPVFIRDNEKAFDPVPPELKDFLFFREVVWNLELRSALYELSHLNLLVNNGPIGLCIYSSRIRYLIFKMVTNGDTALSLDSYRSSSEEYFEKRVGISVGGQWPAATPFQKFIWEDDNLEVIQREFKAMCGKIESRG